MHESTWVCNYSCESTLVRSGQQYLLLCPLARKREDILSLGTLLCSAVDRHEALEKTKWQRETTNKERETESERETKINIVCMTICI